MKEKSLVIIGEFNDQYQGQMHIAETTKKNILTLISKPKDGQNIFTYQVDGKH